MLYPRPIASLKSGGVSDEILTIGGDLRKDLVPREVAPWIPRDRKNMQVNGQTLRRRTMSPLALLTLGASLSACSGGGGALPGDSGLRPPRSVAPVSTSGPGASTPTQPPLSGTPSASSAPGSLSSPASGASAVPGGPVPGPTPTALPAPGATPVPTPVPATAKAPGLLPTATPIPPGTSADDAYTILAPSQPVPEAQPGDLCIGGQTYTFTEGDDFTQETQAQFASYTTSWEINQYQYPAPQYTGKSNWLWSDALSGIGRGNNAGTDDSYYVHIDDANPSRSYPGPWVNSVQPRPGPQIIGTPPNSYMLIRGVYAPAGHEADLGGRHWLSGAIEGQNFRYGYTESTAEFTKGPGWWPSDWTEVTPSGLGYYGNGQGYQEFDTFEYFGGIQGPTTVQQTEITPNPSLFSRTNVPTLDTQYHTYGQLWVPDIAGVPGYIVFYIDRQPTNYYFMKPGQAQMNPISVLQIGAPGSFVSSPPVTAIGELKLKNYFTWHATSAGCNQGSASGPIPLPSPPPAPIQPPAVAGNIAPRLQAFIQPSTTNYKQVFLPFAPPSGALVIIQGISHFSQCPTGFTLTGFGDAYLCTGIVGQGGVGSATAYDVGGNGLDKSTAVYVTNVSKYTVMPVQFQNGLTVSPGSISRSVTVPASNGLLLAFGYNFGDSNHVATSTAYSSDSSMNVVYQSNSDMNLNAGISMLESQIDPFSAQGNTVTFTGNYAWAGSTVTNALIPQIFTVFVQ